ncbi:hypothetical protein RO3G_15168 [Rhizopus delemar RA 99-880]|uniref:Tc1-like transposase DDE domain-containing protein n=1 Tax=Rhizopus delemar (strain RA 99-880 / ATCC MYA-4621 / FGSC 9543 / NRRL 43880) TaxID=246409 RepID=I1CPS7_RHIO9|nr:hypothetical protein RO3G_15168 [Rhizopus delemar RA 99-880]|eukprot:EIE90457.1 hypothetical protein RO3G_15168 [Rhizopus delemar RA 99-880]
MPRALPQDTQDSIKSALMSNRSSKDIAGEFGIHPKTVRRYRNKLFGPTVPARRGRHILVSSATKEYIKWHQVVFSDETKINIWGSDGCRYYWTQPGDVLRPHHIDISVKHGGGKLIMWGCITSEGPGYACQVYDGTMDSLVYQHILGTTYMETLKYYGMNKRTIYLQQDNDPKHKSKSTMSWLQQNMVRYINDWPPNSPDLNPIEHVWHLLKLRLSLYERKARNIDELWERVDVEWNKLDKDVCRSYIDSMPDRIAAVIKSKGRFTRY